MSRFLYVGNWGFQPAPKGISIFEYDEESGSLSLIKNIRQDIAAGQLYMDKENKILYSVNECGDRRGEYGGGGAVLSFRIDEKTGNLELINERDSLCPEPSYLCIDGSDKYILTSHCADPWHVTKIVRNEDGTLSNQVLFDDGAIVVFRINEDGSIGDAVDYATWPVTNIIDDRHQVNVDPVSGHIQLVEMVSRLHCVVASPDRKMFVTCDKGMDKVYAFKLSENGMITKTDEWLASWRSFPRYAAFHPVLPLLYTNSEFSDEVNVFKVDTHAGTIEHLSKLSMLDKDYGEMDGKPIGAQDIQVHPNGHALYVTTNGINAISVFTLNEKGMPELIQVEDSRGILPRGITFSPDMRFLLSGNMLSNDITVFRIKENGSLEYTGNRYDAVSPSALKFF